MSLLIRRHFASTSDAATTTTTGARASSSSSAAPSSQPPQQVITATTATAAAPEHDDSSSASKTNEPLALPHLYRYLQLQEFSREEMEAVFDRIRQLKGNDDPADGNTDDDGPIQHLPPSSAAADDNDKEEEWIHVSQIQRYLVQRVQEMEMEQQQQQQHQHEGFGGSTGSTMSPTDGALVDSQAREEFCRQQAQRFLRVFATTHDESSLSSKDEYLSKRDFVRILHDEKASRIDWRRVGPISGCMLLVGSSVGVITPAMPFIIQHLNLTPGQYGMVVSAFGLARMAGNVPAAILVEQHGRKPYMTYSLLLIAAGVGGVGLAGSFEELYLYRLLTGLGVASLTTAAFMMVTDISTPLNRASTMAPISSCFAAGTALGPALGGILVDQVGLHQTFYVVGASFLGVAALNRVTLAETKLQAVEFPWQHDGNTGEKKKKKKQQQQNGSFRGEVQKAVGQWVPLLQNSQIRSIMIMNGVYWVALAGAQMTLLPLLLTDSNGLAMTATQVGQTYMGMSIIQIVGNPIFARFIDRVGKAPAISGGSALISGAMAAVPLCQDFGQLAVALGIWSMGGSMLSTAPLALVSDKVQERERAQAVALLRTSGDVGFFVGASTVGALAEWTGLDLAMQTSAGALLTATAWFTVRQILNARIAAAATAAAAADASNHNNNNNNNNNNNTSND